ncbi:MAG: carboxylate-amine ligase [Acidobacteria bacterium]|nr:MAG: carboxylate-amine ligase [Acidobacteriota bacterium]
MSNSETAAFRRLQARLATIWRAVESQKPFEHTSLVVPSLSFDPEELAKITGVPFYEERLLFSLMRLRDPHARCLYVTSQPVHPEIVDYYLQLLVGVPSRHAKSRLELLCTYDASPRPLTEKILERPRLVERIRRFLGDPAQAYLTCFNATELERRLALTLNIPLNGVDPDLLWLGTKSGSRKVFAAAGVDHPPGFEDVSDERQLVAALAALAQRQPGIRKAVIKLDESFAGAGNALFRYPDPLPDDDGPRKTAIHAALADLAFSADETSDAFLRKLRVMGGIVEAFVEAREVRSPSVQMRISPAGDVELVSTHDQVLGGATGQSYAGCRFPADPSYRRLIQDAAMKIGQVLRDHGVISRFAVDFLTLRDRPTDPWRVQAIEINLRMGGTTPPFLALQFLTGGRIDPQSGELRTERGIPKFYYATDSLRSPAYRGLLPEDFIDILARYRVCFLPTTETGVLFHMIGALSEYGKVGVTCIGDSREEADELLRRTTAVLDRETGGGAPATISGMFELGHVQME